MKNMKVMLLGMLLLPWAAVPIIGKKTFKRYLPGTIFIAALVLAESIFARKKKWWWIFEKLNPRILGEFPMIMGPFFIGTLFILKYTFGHPFRYFTVNAAIDSFFIYKFLGWLKQLGIATLVKMNSFGMVVLFMAKSAVLYLFQLQWEKFFMNNKKQRLS